MRKDSRSKLYKQSECFLPRRKKKFKKIQDSALLNSRGFSDKKKKKIECEYCEDTKSNKFQVTKFVYGREKKRIPSNDNCDYTLL